MTFEITFDWFIKPNNFAKVLEGNYSKANGGANDGCFKQNISKGKGENLHCKRHHFPTEYL